MKYYVEIISAIFISIYDRRWNDWKVNPQDLVMHLGGG